MSWTRHALTLWVLLSAAAGFGKASAQEAAPPIDSILKEMAAKGREFNGGQLQALGVPGLSAVMDRLFPESIVCGGSGLTEEQVKTLIEKMGDDDIQVRESATDRLLKAGKSIALDLLNATKHRDLEIQLRTSRIVQSWRSGSTGSVRKYLPGFVAYVRTLKDGDLLRELAVRTRTILLGGVPDDPKLSMIRTCLEAIGRSRDDRTCNLLEALLMHPDPSVPSQVIRSLASSAYGGWFPSLLVEALKSRRGPVVKEAIAWSTKCHDPTHRAEVKHLLVGIFEGNNDPLKFQASFTLMHTFQYRPAVDYLVTQTRSPDKKRVYIAISWIGDACNWGKPATPEILKHVVPYLSSEDGALRRAAADALATYSGEEVVKHLVPMLGDELSIIVREVSSKLSRHRDKEMVRRFLSEAAKHAKSLKVKLGAQELLRKIDQKR